MLPTTNTATTNTPADDGGPTKVAAAPLPEWKRLAFLPRFFGRYFVRGENLVYAWLSRLASEYRGGLWQFYELSNGGFYLAPLLERPLTVRVDGNGYDGVMSADAAGVVACLFALGQLAHELDGTSAGAALSEHYHRLREYALDHLEAPAILHAID
jgi:hypothetical protein